MEKISTCCLMEELEERGGGGGGRDCKVTLLLNWFIIL